jgi:proteasome lid subunit RPN8/RPN11
MLEDCRKRAPLEACGLVAGLEDASTAVYPAQNALNSPVRYRLDAVEQIRLFEEIESAGWDLMAIYHSHPAGPPYPSSTDIAEAGYPETAYLIWSGDSTGWSCRAFRILDGDFSELKVEVIN